MMKMYKRISLFIFALLLCANAFAQKNFYKEAEKKFNSFEYYAAIDLYKAAYKKANKKLLLPFIYDFAPNEIW